MLLVVETSAQRRIIAVLDTTSLIGRALGKHVTGDTVHLPTDDGGEAAYRIRERRERPAIHVHYIYLDGHTLRQARINALRDSIMEAVEQGGDLGPLVERYTMDGNRTGELGWALADDFVPEFRDAVLAHAAGDLFRVDVPENKWYYVVYKDDPDRWVPEYDLVQVP